LPSEAGHDERGGGAAGSRHGIGDVGCRRGGGHGLGSRGSDAGSGTLPDAREQTPFQRNFAAYCESKIAVAGLVVLVLLCLLALFAPWVAPQNPYDLSRLDLMDSRQEPGSSRSTEP
jgi:hypothetical protein